MASWPTYKDILGGVLANPQGATQRGLSNYFPGLLTGRQQAFLANYSRTVALLKREILGSQQTSVELKNNAAALPDVTFPDDKVLAQLQAILARLTYQQGVK